MNDTVIRQVEQFVYRKRACWMNAGSRVAQAVYRRYPLLDGAENYALPENKQGDHFGG